MRKLLQEKQPVTRAMNGGEAVAFAMLQSNIDVVAAYPITPQTLIIEKFAEYIAEGLVDTEFMTVESEHAALSACVGASAAGARAATATAGPGLALMFEMLGVTSGLRLPIVMHLCTRSLSGPLNILEDHSDAMAMRETGWIMLSGNSPQEAYDLAMVAHVIAEHPDVRLPLANMIDGFAVTHSVERVDVLPHDTALELVGEYRPAVSLLTPGQAPTFGSMDFREHYFEHRRQQEHALSEALPVVKSAFDRFAQASGRRYRVVEPYRMDDAEIALVMAGSSDGMVKAAVDRARSRGIKAGMVRLRLIRPFPTEEVAWALAGVKGVGVLDKAIAFGAPANPIMSDLMGVLWESTQRPTLQGFVYGLGGRTLTAGMCNRAIDEVLTAMDRDRASPETSYLGLKEERRDDAEASVAN